VVGNSNNLLLLDKERSTNQPNTGSSSHISNNREASMNATQEVPHD